MNRLRNPFRMRASEKIISDANFLGIYSPSIIDLLIESYNESKLWDNVTYIHSSPGGGKTSLLRLFEPSVLNSLHSSQSHYKDLYSNLKKLNIFENKVSILGIYLLCSRSFEILEDINVQEPQKKRLFFSLLNSRVILATLKNILILKGRKFPDNLKDISFKYDDLNNYFSGLRLPCNGEELYNWAASFEEKIFSALDSLIPVKESSIPGHNELFSFFTMSPESLTLGEEPVCERFLFMLDDAHVLTYKQRNFIREAVIEKRGAFTLWIAERIEALEPVVTLNQRNIRNRDFHIINLEDFYRGKDSKVSTLFSNISEKRALLSLDNLSSFQDHLSIVLNENKYKDQFQRSIDDTIEYFELIKGTTTKFDFWIDYVAKQNDTLENIAVLYKQIEILIQRSLNKQQLTLDFWLPLEELENQLGGEIKSAAIYFICKNYKIPYYYGFSNLVKISSCNIEQFLSFSSELFERMLSNNLLGNSIDLTAEDQDKIISDVALQKWKSLSNNIPYSQLVLKFLKKLGSFCKEETDKKNAPYAPGVNGFAIRENSKGLFGTLNWYESESFDPLVNVISTCVAFNLLEVKPTNQGQKGQLWNVYYLNRWLCVYFQLPLTYGNWRPKAATELQKWLR